MYVANYFVMCTLGKKIYGSLFLELLKGGWGAETVSEARAGWRGGEDVRGGEKPEFSLPWCSHVFLLILTHLDLTSCST